MRTRHVLPLVYLGVVALCSANQGGMNSGSGAQSEAFQISHSRRDLKAMQATSAIISSINEAQKRGDFAKAEDLLVNRLMRREPGVDDNHLWASRLYFEMGRNKDAASELQRFMAKHDFSQESTLYRASIQCYQDLLRRSQGGKHPAWRDFQVKGEVVSASEVLVGECESAIVTGYFRTAKLILAEMKRAGTDGETYNLIKDRLAKAQKERADAQPQP